MFINILSLSLCISKRLCFVCVHLCMPLVLTCMTNGGQSIAQLKSTRFRQCIVVYSDSH